VLIVGETDHFASHGGCIGFFIDSNKVRFEINVDAAKRAELDVSSQVLKLARIVKEELGSADAGTRARTSIRGKLTRMLMLVSTWPLARGALLALYDWSQFQSSKCATWSHGDVLGVNTRSAIEFEDAEFANTTLKALESKQHISRRGCTRERHGAGDLRARRGHAASRAAAAEGHVIEGNSLRMWRKIEVDGRRSARSISNRTSSTSTSG